MEVELGKEVVNGNDIGFDQPEALYTLNEGIDETLMLSMIIGMTKFG